MRRIILIRVLREFKSNIFRYFTLFILVSIAMYIVISTIGSAWSVMVTVNNNANATKLESGSFTTFSPLKEKDINQIEESGVKLEETFSLDYRMDDLTVLRIFKNRENINKITIQEGKIANSEDEIVLERHYANENGYNIGSEISINNINYKVTGIATSADYDAVLRQLDDISADGKHFGTAFLTNSGYDLLKSSGNQLKSEEFSYSYILPEDISNLDLKAKLKDIKININEIEDASFRDIIEEKFKDKRDLKSAGVDLLEGAKDLSSGMKNLDENGILLKDKIEKLKLVNKSFEFISEPFSEYHKGIKKADEATVKLSEGIEEYTDKIGEIADELYPEEINNLVTFVPAENNHRIKASVVDVEIDFKAGVVAGIIVLILISYVISVFVTHSIEKDNTIIGTLMALGIRKYEILSFYIILPTLLTFVGGITGLTLAYTPIGMALHGATTQSYFSIPKIITQMHPLLIIYCIIMPPLVAYIVNLLVINKKFNTPTLMLLRNIKNVPKIKIPKIGKNLSFIPTFQLKQFWKEKRSGVAVLGGMLISLLVMYLGLTSHVFCSNIKNMTSEYTKYNYMYQYKYQVTKIPRDGYAGNIKMLSKEFLDDKMDVMILGFQRETPYFPKINSNKQNQISISSSMAKKFSLKEGQKLVLSDELNEIDYGFTVKEIVDYPIGLTCFMDKDSMDQLFNYPKDSYNVIYSDKKLDINPNDLHNTKTKRDIEKSAEIFLEQMKSMVTTMLLSSTAMMIIVMYQMIKIMMDRSSLEISLFKIFGYRETEIRKLYMDGNFYLVAIGALIAVPMAKYIMDKIYPLLISNVASQVDFGFSFKMYAMIYIGIIIIYLIVRTLILWKINKISPQEVLSNRE